MSDLLNSCCENHEGRQLVGMRTMERNRIHQVIERFSKKQITQHIKFLSAQITAIEGEVDDEIDSDPTLREKVKIMTSVPSVGPGARTLVSPM
jgi:transposase